MKHCTHTSISLSQWYEALLQRSCKNARAWQTLSLSTGARKGCFAKQGGAGAGWSYSGGNITSPRQAGKESVTILHRFHFTSALKRMTCILKVLLSHPSTSRLFSTTITKCPSHRFHLTSALTCTPALLIKRCITSCSSFTLPVNVCSPQGA
jgi:hypothetical protein